MKSPLPEEKGPTFEPSTHWCQRHLQPFRERWPVGWGLAMMALFQVAVRREDVQAAAGYNEAKGTQADTKMLDRVMREFAPICCLVGDEETARWTNLALGPFEDYKLELDRLTGKA